MTTRTRAAGTGGVVVLVLLSVWFLWPVTLGGGTTYVTTYGSSMAPDFQGGDLAVLRSAGEYSVGDVVAYRSDSLDTVVMHRIVSGDPAGFVTQGDNNDWLDEDRPTGAEILGRLVIRIPHGGKVLDAMASPGPLVLLAGAVATVVSSGQDARRGRRRRPPGRRVPVFSVPTRARARQAAVGGAGVALLAAATCCALLAAPATQTAVRTVEVAQQGQFTYTARAVSGTTYPSGTVATGDTVWTRLSEDVTVSFTDTLSGPGLTGVTGGLRLDVVVAAADGWSAVLASGPAARFDGGTATATVAVDPEAAAELVGRHHAEIGTSGGSATLTVTPVVEATGTVAGRRFTAEAPDGLTFGVEALALRLVGEVGPALAPRATLPVEVEEIVPRTFHVLAAEVPYDVARQAAGVALLLSLVVLVAGMWIGGTGRGDAAGRFLVRHADRILPVQAFSPGRAVVDVSDAESLHRVAERFDTVVLHHAAPEGDVFAVRDADMTYRFVMPGGPGPRRSRPPVPPPATAAVPPSASLSDIADPPPPPVAQDLPHVA